MPHTPLPTTSVVLVCGAPASPQTKIMQMGRYHTGTAVPVTKTETSMQGYSVEEIRDVTVDGGEGLLAIVMMPTGERVTPGIHFVTDPSLSQQVAVMAHGKGHTIPPHVHLLSPREVRYTQETLLVVRGVVAVDLYTSGRQFVCRRVLFDGSVLVLVGGGHGFEVIEDCEMVEIKQGPFDPKKDKERF